MFQGPTNYLLDHVGIYLPSASHTTIHYNSQHHAASIANLSVWPAETQIRTGRCLVVLGPSL